MSHGGHESGGGGGPDAEAASFIFMAFFGASFFAFLDEVIPEMLDKPQSHGH